MEKEAEREFELPETGNDLVVQIPGEEMWASIEDAMRAVFGAARKQFEAVGLSGRLDFDLELYGSLGDPNTKLTYKVQKISGASASGKNLHRCIQEVFRRETWDNANAPKMIASSGDAQF